MRKKLFCIVLAMILLLSACSDDSATVRKGKTRKAPETERKHSEEKNPTPDTDTPTPTPDAPTPTPEQELHLRMWCVAVENDSTRPAYDRAVREMRKKYPDICLDWEAMQLDDYKMKIKAVMANPEGNPVPDIFYTYGGHFLEDFVTLGRVLCLDDYYEDYADVLPKNTCVNVTYNGKLYGIPTNYNVVLMFSNMEVLEKVGYTEVPATAEELIDCCDKLLAFGYTPFALGAGAAGAWCVAEYLESIMLQIVGADALNDLFMGRASWDNEDIAKAMDMLQTMIRRGYFNEDSPIIGNDKARSYFEDGKCAFYVNGSWSCADIANYPGMDGKVKVSAFPVVNPDKGSSKAFIGGPTDGLAVYAGSPNADIAGEYAFELAQLISKYAYEDGCGFAAFTGDYEDEYLNDLTRQAAELLDGARMVLYSDALMYMYDVEKYYIILSDFMLDLFDGNIFINRMKADLR